MKIMGIKQLQHKIIDIIIWKKGKQPALHKPFLYVLSKHKHDHTRSFNYKIEIEQPLLNLLKRLRPQCKYHNSNMPLGRLR